MPSPLLAQAQNLQQRLTAWRRHLHRHPELSGEEAATARFVADALREMDYQPRTDIGGKHGVTVDIPVGDTPFLALRADMDALPITEETGVEYASQNPGVMHACGHDAHTAMLLGAAEILARHRDQLRTSVRLIFQPHEEKFPGGAPDMIAAGSLENVARIFGIHICSDLPSGTVGTRAGGFMAGVNKLAIRIRGVGGHAAMPNQCNDPVVAAAHVIVALQTIVSRNVPVSEPAVVSVTQVRGGTADNVIPEYVDLVGTIRTFAAEVRDLTTRRVREIATSTAATLGCTAEVDVSPGYPVLVNDPAETERALASAETLGFAAEQIVALAPQGGGEDFSYFCQEVPGCFVFVGARDEASECIYPHHHPRFNIDEGMLAWGAALHAQVALDAGDRS